MHQLYKIHVAGAMNKAFCQKIQISMRTIQDFSIVMISEFMLLTNRCINSYVEFLLVASKVLLPKLAYTALALHCHGRLRTRRYNMVSHRSHNCILAR